jgi:uncharacterized membrane protein YbaN (DUF454 family)
MGPKPIEPGAQAAAIEIPESRILSCPGVRHGLFAFGLLNVVAGIVGLLLPVWPSTVFFLIALWAFSKSSTRFHAWLYTHPRLGRPLRDWHAHRMIPLRAKIAAVATMGASLLFVTVYVAEDWVLPAGLGAVLAVIAAYIVTRPHRVSA